MWGYGLDQAVSGQGQVVGTCKCGNEPSGSVKCGEYLDQLQTSQLLKKDSAHGASKLFGLFGTRKSDKLHFILMALSSYMLVEQASTAAPVFLLVNCLGGWWLWLCCVVVYWGGHTFCIWFVEWKLWGCCCGVLAMLPTSLTFEQVLNSNVLMAFALISSIWMPHAIFQQDYTEISNMVYRGNVPSFPHKVRLCLSKYMF